MNSFNYRIGWLEADFAVLRAKYENLDSRILEMESRLQKLEKRLPLEVKFPTGPFFRFAEAVKAEVTGADYPYASGMNDKISIPEPETPLPALENKPFSNCK